MTTNFEPQLGSSSTPDDAPRLGGEARRLHAIESLSSPDHEVRAHAVEALGLSSDSGSLDLLLNLLDDPDTGIQAEAAAALGARRERAAVPALIGKLTAPTDAVRAGAVRALGRIGDRRAYDAVLTCLRDPDMTVRAYTLAALGWLGKHDTVAIIARHLDEIGYTQFHVLQFAAAHSLMRLAVRHPASVMALTTHASTRVAWTAVDALGLAFTELDTAMHGAVLGQIISGLSYGDVPVQRAALKALGRAGAADIPPAIRARAVKAIGGLLIAQEGSGVVDIRHRGQTIRFRGGYALLAGDQYVLRDALDALTAIATIDAEAVMPLFEVALKLVEHPTREVREAAVRLLNARDQAHIEREQPGMGGPLDD